ncbi:hypothetical protein [Spiroplasma citri]|uniref:Plectrovirus-related protein n=2 Tax=Spiroplasma citri TaxID=2133 RepID=A0AAJ4EK57_SPICI|nr:hypothetical protein [Spiroplasma citri]QIA67420.1 hypothetical protein GMI18_07120 [Spiroplasma citri]QIA69274.1 hypothetical protein GL298_07075 [Spiroplasma citri]QIA71141.1 hypothetical protein GL981_07130 [Spiroplasma citri]QIA73214.1 hypothetical protein GL982_06085 [Spiroplasma citri]QIA75310.1 hypothetical protein GTU57_06380 [Spiroplasma citri]
MKCNKSTPFWVDFLMERKHYFILRSLVTKYGKDNVINTVNKIVINNVKENE